MQVTEMIILIVSPLCELLSKMPPVRGVGMPILVSAVNKYTSHIYLVCSFYFGYSLLKEKFVIVDTTTVVMFKVAVYSLSCCMPPLRSTSIRSERSLS